MPFFIYALETFAFSQWMVRGVVLCIAAFTVSFVSDCRCEARTKSTRVQTSAELLKQGKTQYEARQYATAARSFTQALQKGAGGSEILLLRGKCYERMGMIPAAIADFSKSIRLNPKDTAAYLARGDARNFNQDHESAIADYNAVMGTNSTSVAAHMGRGLAYVGLQQYDQAIKDYQWILRVRPNHLEALENMGIACMLSGRKMEAMTYFQKAMEQENDVQWRGRIDKWMEQLLQQADAVSKPEGIPGNSRSRGLW